MSTNTDDYWGPMILKKKPDPKTLPKKFIPAHDPTKKVLEEDFPTVKKVQPSVCHAIMQARAALGLKQKEFATKINEKEQTVHEYENGSAIPSPQVLSKMERVLGVKLRGNSIGEKLAPKPKN